MSKKTEESISFMKPMLPEVGHAAQDPQCRPLSKEYTLWLHKELCERLPEEWLWVNNPDTSNTIKRCFECLRRSASPSL